MTSPQQGEGEAGQAQHQHPRPGPDACRDAIALYRAVLASDEAAQQAILATSCGPCVALIAVRWGILLSQTGSGTNTHAGLEDYLRKAQQVTLREDTLARLAS